MRKFLVFIFVFSSCSWGLNAISQETLGNPKAKKGGSFSINIQAEPSTLNPITSSDGYAAEVQSYIIEHLADKHPETYEWIPWLAEKYSISADGTEFTFHLRKNLKFHDGHALTAEDIKFSFDVNFDNRYKTAHRRPYYSEIKECKIVDSYTVKFKTKSKYFKNFSSIALLDIVPKHIYDNPNAENLNKTITGSGPYILEKYEQGKRIILKRDPNWWGQDLPFMKGMCNFDQIIMRFIKEDNIAIEALKNGSIDFIDKLTAEAFHKKATGLQFGTTIIKHAVDNLIPKQESFIGWNLKRPLFNDKKVRKALAHLMDRDGMNKKFRYGESLLSTGPWYQQSEYASPQTKPILFNPKEAEKLLKEAGWADTDKSGILSKQINGKKEEFRFTLIYVKKDNEKYFTTYKEDLKKSGIVMNLKIVEWNTFVKLLDDKNFDAIAMAWSGVIELDPKQIWHSASSVAGGSNFISYNNPEVDRLIDQARSILDNKTRVPVLRKVYELIAEDAPYLFLYEDRYIYYAKNKRIEQLRDFYKYGLGEAYWWVKQ